VYAERKWLSEAPYGWIKHVLGFRRFSLTIQGEKSMRILITSAGHDRSAALADHLAQDNEVRLTERTYVETEHEFALSGLGHDSSTNLLTRGIDAIIHAVEPLPGEDVSSQLDAATRCTYNLLMAAAEEGVQQVILLSTLELMDGYPPGYRVAETWRPLPSTEPPTLAKHMAEQVGREFAREGSLGVTVLRLGEASYRPSPSPSTRPSPSPPRSPPRTGHAKKAALKPGPSHT